MQIDEIITYVSNFYRSSVSFFCYEVDPSDGEAITTHGWSTSSAVNAALASGNTKVTLTVTLFSNHATFFSSTSSQQTLISNLISLVQSRGAHGVNIDFGSAATVVILPLLLIIYHYY